MSDKKQKNENTSQSKDSTGKMQEKSSFSRKLVNGIDTVMTSANVLIPPIFRTIGIIFLVIVLACSLFACVFALYVKTCLTPELNVTLDDYRLNRSSTLWYQDSSGQWVELANLTGRENRVWVNYDDIPKYMEQAVVAIEDKRFYEHKGVDWYRTSGAFIQMFATMQNSYGGSTITQQLIKNLTGQDDITVQRKLTEIFSAIELEKKYDKQEIIEWYLNAVYFGEGAYGVQTAAKTYFNKDIQDLSLAECAAIAGITNKPTYYDPFYSEQNNKERQETILKEMYLQGFITYDEYKDACAEELVFSRSPEETYTQDIYSYYEETVIDDVIADLMELKGISSSAARQLVFSGGYNIYTFYEPSAQAAVNNVYEDLNQIPKYGGTQQLQSSIVIMDPYNGAIVALSGGVGQKSINFGLNRATQTKRSPGSSIKPLASYGIATEMGYITPKTLVEDSANIRLSGTSWFPKNDGGSNYGYMTILEALTASVNTVAAQIIDKISPEVSYNYLINKLGFTSLVPDDCAYAPMALGQLTNGVTVREMAAAYCSFVNDGIFTYSRTYSLVTDKDGNTIIDNSPSTIRAWSENTAHVMTYMLENVVTSGTGTEANFRSMAVAGKTGTSGEYNDRWFVGCTPYYVAAVWTGYDIPGRVNSGGNPAAQLFKKVMQPIHDGLQYKSFTYPYIGEDTGIFGVTMEQYLGIPAESATDDTIQADDIILPDSYFPSDETYQQDTTPSSEFFVFQ